VIHPFGRDRHPAADFRLSLARGGYAIASIPCRVADTPGCDDERRIVTVTKGVATFGAGCFWQVEVEFRNVPGVLDTAVGYMGGTLADPTYRDVCTDRTGHAEVVQAEYDATRVAYDDLLEVFWRIHNPTTKNRQGWDFGSQYRSVVFFHDSEQEVAAWASLRRAQPRFRRPIVTEITPAGAFWRAEEYHQRYLEKRGLASCTLGEPVR
jgi:peptide-methionine (S)-S-oxide reductase